MKVLLASQFDTMLSMQRKVNEQRYPAWKSGGHPDWYRLIVIEIIYTTDVVHLAQNPGALLGSSNLIDIWQLMLSIFLDKETPEIQMVKNREETSPGNLSEYISFDKTAYLFRDMRILEKLDLMTALAGVKRTSLALFESILQECGLSWDELSNQLSKRINTGRVNRGKVSV